MRPVGQTLNDPRFRFAESDGAAEGVPFVASLSLALVGLDGSLLVASAPRRAFLLQQARERAWQTRGRADSGRQGVRCHLRVRPDAEVHAGQSCVVVQPARGDVQRDLPWRGLRQADEHRCLGLPDRAGRVPRGEAAAFQLHIGSGHGAGQERSPASIIRGPTATATDPRIERGLRKWWPAKPFFARGWGRGRITARQAVCGPVPCGRFGTAEKTHNRRVSRFGQRGVILIIDGGHHAKDTGQQRSGFSRP